MITTYRYWDWLTEVERAWNTLVISTKGSVQLAGCEVHWACIDLSLYWDSSRAARNIQLLDTSLKDTSEEHEVRCVVNPFWSGATYIKLRSETKEGCYKWNCCHLWYSRCRKRYRYGKLATKLQVPKLKLIKATKVGWQKCILNVYCLKMMMSP